MPEAGRRGPARALRAGIERFIGIVGECAAWISLVIVVLMAVNVLLRYAFSIGSVWAQELEWHLLAPLILFGMSYTLRHGEHVRVDIIYGRFPERTKHVVDLISALLTIALSILVIWFSLNYVHQSYVIDEGSPDPGGLPHRFLLKSLIPIGFALLLLQAIASALLSVEKIREREL